MKTDKIFIFSHQDDELGVFNHIKKALKDNHNVNVFFLTNGRIKNKKDKKIVDIREKESIKVLKKLGVSRNKIFFIGKKLNINVYELYNHLIIVYKKLSKLFKNTNKRFEIFTHSWEGGNTDHDSCYLIVLKLFKKFNNINCCYQFSLYHGHNMPFTLYKVLAPLKNNGIIIKEKINIIEKLKMIYLLFLYPSQFKVWIGLYPIIIFKIFFNRYGHIQKIKKNIFLNKPHSGKLWYEKRNFLSYKEFKNKALLFLNAKVI